MKRAFTLVELLVVISIVSMLASVVMVQISLAQANGRDAVRTQQIKQIDLATQMYVDTYKKTPPLYQTGCDEISESTPDEQAASACFAVSTAEVGSLQHNNWIAYRDALEEFIKIPDDPCKGSCVSSSSEFPIGYTYVAPLAVQYYCDNGGECTASDDTYQVYAPMERQTVPSGNNGSSNSYAAVIPPLPSVSAPSNLSYEFSMEFGPTATFTWSPSITTYPGQSIQRYTFYKYNQGTGVYTQNKNISAIPVDNTYVTLTPTAWELRGFIPPFCISLIGVDTAVNNSNYATPLCIDSWE
ncbi:MAG: type II secretion system protein [Candidatus Pacebacteria bacterium]|nr:type II secretion system protein [Candidatus Paceibacterota bacterium]